LGFDPDLDPEPDGHDNLPDLGEIKQEDDSKSAQHKIKADSLLYFSDKKLPARFDLVHDRRARQKHKAEDHRLKKKQLCQAMRRPQSSKHSAARETKTSPERGEDVGPMDLGKSETDDDAKEAELPARKGDESDGTRKTRSGCTTKLAPRLTLKAETKVKPHRRQQSPLDAAMAAALLMLRYTRLKNIFEMTDPIVVVEEAERQIVMGFSPEVIEMTEKLEEGLPGVDLQSLTPAARSHLRHVQYLDLLYDLRKSTEPDPEEVWKPVAILDHSLQTHNKDDVHIKVKVLWSNGEETWVRVNALLVNEPIMLTEYARKN
jgi:hypothetical protein